MKKIRGFTFIEVLITVGLLGILTAIAVIAIDPQTLFSRARNSTRENNLIVILDAVSQNIFENAGTFVCSVGPVPTSTPTMMGSSTYHIGLCLAPAYLGRMPVDPQTGVWRSDADYATGYTIQKSTTTGRITVSAPSTEIPPATVPISETR